MEKFNLPARPRRRFGSTSTTWPTAVEPLGIATTSPTFTSSVTSKRTGSSTPLVAELRDCVSDRRTAVASWILSVRAAVCAISIAERTGRETHNKYFMPRDCIIVAPSGATGHILHWAGRSKPASVYHMVRVTERQGRSEEHTSELQSLRHLVC